jgi:nucleoside 2-deoxyribosyltransferase
MNEPKVFISYSHDHDEVEWVRQFAEALRTRRVNVWWDAWEVAVGERLSEAIEAGLRDSDAIVAVLSQTRSQRPDLLFELGAALGMGKRLIPIVPEDLEKSSLPFAWRSRRYVHKGAPDEAAREVAEALRGKAA